MASNVGRATIRRRRLPAVAAGCAAIALAAGMSPLAAAERRPEERPNVVVVMTDDQTVAQLAAMPRTRSLIGDQGAEFANSFVTFPLCCPSRATFVTGQYTHNHGVLNNIPPFGFPALRARETLPVWLQRSGYATGMVGKLMNGYETSPVGVPPGWHEWHATKTENHYYGNDLYENGRLVRYGSPNEDPDSPAQPETYSTDLYTTKAVEIINRFAPEPRPFFVWVSYNAPHAGLPDPPPGRSSPCRGNAKPAARHRGRFARVPLPVPPSFNEADISDKPRSVRAAPPLTADIHKAITNSWRCELESLLAVDEGVERIVAALAAAGELDRTAIAVTSDNGLFHGEHRIPFGKNLVYEEALRVPLLIRGPGVPAGTVVEEPVSNVDLAPTILDLAGAEPGVPQDGRSLMPLIRRPSRARGREVRIDTNRTEGVRTPRYLYARHFRGDDAGAIELYDLARDPYQLDNVARDRRYRAERRALRARLEVLRACEGAECHTRPRLRLRQERRTSARGRARCPSLVAVAVRGADVRWLRTAAFFLGHERVRRDRIEPYRIHLPRQRLANSGRLRLEAVMVDGRELTLRRKLRCRPATRSQGG